MNRSCISSKLRSSDSLKIYLDTQFCIRRRCLSLTPGGVTHLTQISRGLRDWMNPKR